MNKKQAEEDAIKKAKETAHAAGKNTGMSGRDLVRLVFCLSDLSPQFPSLFPALDRGSNLIAHSLRSTPSGSRKRKKGRKRIGIWTSIEDRRKRKTRLQSWNGFGSLGSKMVLESKLGL